MNTTSHCNFGSHVRMIAHTLESRIDRGWGGWNRYTVVFKRNGGVAMWIWQLDILKALQHISLDMTFYYLNNR